MNTNNKRTAEDDNLIPSPKKLKQIPIRSFATLRPFIKSLSKEEMEFILMELAKDNVDFFPTMNRIVPKLSTSQFQTSDEKHLINPEMIKFDDAIEESERAVWNCIFMSNIHAGCGDIW